MNKKELLLYYQINFVLNLFHSFVQLLKGILYRIVKRYNGGYMLKISTYIIAFVASRATKANIVIAQHNFL